ncbi:MAG: RNA-binding S4 domain-containing protein [Peptococcaceae bacterium]|nr:RNA-binding S4 domain-containing protein [Peptococcaceae bacterium]
MRNVSVKGSIRLDQFLKWAGLAPTGGQGKIMVRSGRVRVNGDKNPGRGRFLSDGDIVSVEGIGDFKVVHSGGAGEEE